MNLFSRKMSIATQKRLREREADQHYTELIKECVKEMGIEDNPFFKSFFNGTFSPSDYFEL